MKRTKYFLWITITLLILVLSSLFVVYQYFGLKEFITAARKLETVSEQYRQASKDNFYTIDTTNQYSGILGGKFEWPVESILIWGKHGPKILKTDEFTVYSHFMFCDSEYLASLSSAGENVKVKFPRTVSRSFSNWNSLSKVGDYVAIQMTTSEMGGNVGYVREVKTNDIWTFMPINIIETCRNEK